MFTARPGSEKKTVSEKFLLGNNLSFITRSCDVSRDGNFGRVSRPATGDLDLSARDVPLGSTSDMEANCFNADQVLSSGWV